MRVAFDVEPLDARDKAPPKLVKKGEPKVGGGAVAFNNGGCLDIGGSRGCEDSVLLSPKDVGGPERGGKDEAFPGIDSCEEDSSYIRRQIFSVLVKKDSLM